jgi:hypothetical protein
MTIKSKRGSNVTPEEHKLVIKFAKQCLKEICKKQYELEYAGKPVVYAEALKRLSVQTKHKGQRSYGGPQRISIDMRYLRNPSYKMTEYSAYATDPVIGEFETNDPELVLFAVVAHEISHHVQMLYGPWTRYLKKTYSKSHGEAFKSIYRELRRTLVNPQVESTKQAA